MPAQTIPLRNGLFPTPPLPEDLPRIQLSENSRKVLTRRYLRKGDDGTPVETIDEMFWRVAYHIAKAEETWGGEVMPLTREFYRLLVSKRFFPNSPTFTGAGTPLGQLAACFVLPIADDMGRDGSGIFQSLRNAALIQQTGGGNGFSFSRLRPKGTIVNSSAGQATGPVGFLRVYDHAFGEIAQGGTRRGANMGVLRVDHPDIEEFIVCKTDENQITNFNISVAITDAFMRAVENDEMWDLRFPDVSSPKYRGFDGTLEQAEAAGIPIKVYKTVRARDLFDKIVRQSHHNGEPGLLFLDTANRDNPVPHLYPLESTNPCGEQWLGPYENCCLGSVNLAQHCAPGGALDWEALQESVELATRFLDDVVEVNAYVPAVPQIKEAAHRARRIGLGIMGLADAMYHVGVRYGAEEAQEFGAQVMEFVRYHAMKTSIALAEERGAFPAIKGSIYDPENLTWTPPQPIFPYRREWGRPALDWDEIKEGIRRNGIRNAAQTTVAPTGTIATVAGCEGYGCEPVFALAYTRHVNDDGKDLQLTYTSPRFEKALIEAGVDEATREEIVEEIMREGSCQHVEAVPEAIRHVFVVSSDITAEEHVRMQAALQAFVDNSLSKTINFPENATEEDVAKAYKLAWELGCKGLTVYVTGSREKVVLETKSTAEKKKEGDRPMIWHERKKPRPRALVGRTYRVDTPLGKAFVTINENGGHQPFEVFVNTSKAGSETAAVSEAIGRLISYILRLASPVAPRDRMVEIVRQLTGIGGGRSSGVGPNRVRSLADGVGQVLREYLREETTLSVESLHKEGEKASGGNGNGKHAQSGGFSLSLNFGTPSHESKSPEHAAHNSMKIGDLCPECGEAALVNEEGCKKCYACGYSEC